MPMYDHYNLYAIIDWILNAYIKRSRLRLSEWSIIQAGLGGGIL